MLDGWEWVEGGKDSACCDLLIDIVFLSSLSGFPERVTRATKSFDSRVYIILLAYFFIWEQELQSEWDAWVAFIFGLSCGGRIRMEISSLAFGKSKSFALQFKNVRFSISLDDPFRPIPCGPKLIHQLFRALVPLLSKVHVGSRKSEIWNRQSPMRPISRHYVFQLRPHYYHIIQTHQHPRPHFDKCQNYHQSLSASPI